jgi:hypothetical protein
VPRLKKLIKLRRRELKTAIEKFGGIDALANRAVDVHLGRHFEVLFGRVEPPPIFPPYVSSFCSHVSDDVYTKGNGLLSMWRGYGRSGGVALVFNTRDLEKCMEAESERNRYNLLSLGDVVYEGDEESFFEVFGAFIETFNERALEVIIDLRSLLLDPKYFQAFIGMAPRYKHVAFSEEREVRLVAIPWSEGDFERAMKDGPVVGNMKEVRTRNGGVPYVDVFEGDVVPRLPIERIIIGPHFDQAARYEEVARLLKIRPEIDVVCSETPYLPPPSPPATPPPRTGEEIYKRRGRVA